MDEELVDIVDDSGNVIRQELKVDAHKHGWRHKTAIGYLKYGDDWALIRQASHKQDAGQLVAPVGGGTSKPVNLMMMLYSERVKRRSVLEI